MDLIKKIVKKITMACIAIKAYASLIWNCQNVDEESETTNNEKVKLKQTTLNRIRTFIIISGVIITLTTFIIYCKINAITLIVFINGIISVIGTIVIIIATCLLLAKQAKDEKFFQLQQYKSQIRAILPQYYDMFRTAILTYSEELHMKRIILNSKIKFKIININENNSTVRAVVEINPFRVNKKYMMKYAKLLSEKIEREIVSAIEDFYCEDILNYSSFVTTKIYNRGYVLQIDFNIDNIWIVKIKNE